MAETFKLTIKTPQKNIFNAEAEMIHLATEGGEIEAFSDHASITGSISFSPVEVKKQNGDSEKYIVRNGLFTFDNEANTASLLALHCEHESEVSQKTVKEYAEFIEQQLREGKNLTDFQVLYLKGEKLAVEEQLKEME